jgi:hypothetical protein
MAIYQAPRKRWRIALLFSVLGLLGGLVIGLVIAGGDPDPVDSVRTLDRQLDETAASLDVLVIHGEVETTSADDPRVASDALRRVKQRFAELRPAVQALDPDDVEDVDEQIASLEELIRDRADADEIADSARELADLLRSIIGE